MVIFLIAGILILVAIIIGIVWLCFWIPKKFGYPKFGKYLSILVGTLIAIFILTQVFEDELFSKNDAKELLEEQNIQLIDEFELTENKSMSGIGDYYHTFTLKITNQDKNKIIREIQKAKNYNSGLINENYFENRDDYYNGPRRIKNYETENQFVRELFQPNGDNYAPTWRKIEIDKKSNLLIFEDIDE
jgi:hypothetical protein